MSRRTMLFVAALALSLIAPVGRAAAAPAAMSVDEIIALAKTGVGYSYWWGGSNWRKDGKEKGSCSGSCPSCTHKGNYGADCSGYVGKVWQVASPTPVEKRYHPYSTSHFTNNQTHWKRIDRGKAARGDALTYNTNGRGHIVLFEKGNPWGSFWAYEAKGCKYGIVHNLRSASSSYIAIRRNNLKSEPTRPKYAAKWVKQHYPTKLPAGTQATVWIEYLNEGAATWDLKNTRLATTNARNRKSPFYTPGNWISAARPTATDHSNYSTGKVGRFTFIITAPRVTKTTTYTEHFGLVQEGVTWFGPCDTCVSFRITVTPSCQDGDGDGYGDGCSKGVDCNDKNKAIHPGATEVCNGVDDDCDKSVDEGNPGGGKPCKTGDKGVCSAGTTSCSKGSIRCVAVAKPSPEVCDGRDNDCDGEIDEGCDGERILVDGSPKVDAGQPWETPGGDTSPLDGAPTDGSQPWETPGGDAPSLDGAPGDGGCPGGKTTWVCNDAGRCVAACGRPDAGAQSKGCACDGDGIDRPSDLSVAACGLLLLLAGRRRWRRRPGRR